jgi:hypothetical protein
MLFTISIFRKQHTSPVKEIKKKPKGRYYIYSKQKVIILISTGEYKIEKKICMQEV